MRQFGDIMTDIISIISKNELFNEVSNKALVFVINNFSTIKNYKKGELIFSKSCYEKSLGIIISGTARVTKGKMLMSKLSKGEVFGTVTLYSDQNHFTTDITSGNDSKILFINKDGVDFLVKNDFSFAVNLISYLSERIYFLTGRLNSLTSGTVEQNLLKYIIDNADYSYDKPTLIVNNYSELALKLDSGRASLYRAMDQLTESGYITKDNKKIILERID